MFIAIHNEVKTQQFILPDLISKDDGDGIDMCLLSAYIFILYLSVYLMHWVYL